MRYVTKDREAGDIRDHLSNVEGFLSVLYKLDLSDEVRVKLVWRASVRHAVYQLEIKDTGHRIERLR